MSKISNPFMMKFFTRFFMLFVSAKVISLGFLWYLPDDGVTQVSQKSFVPEYQKVDFKMMLHNPKKGEVGDKNLGNGMGVNTTTSGTTIEQIYLRGIYATPKRGFIVVAKKANPSQTTIISLGEEYEGFVLHSILRSSVLFYKNAKEYILELESVGSNKQQALQGEKKQNATESDKVDISKDDISYFKKNPEEIWKEISISELKDGEEMRGFEVKDIKKGSKFESLGLKKGDVIVKVNNVALKSYKDAIEIYENVGDISGIALSVLRDNQEVELVYEVN